MSRKTAKPVPPISDDEMIQRWNEWYDSVEADSWPISEAEFSSIAIGFFGALGTCPEHAMKLYQTRCIPSGKF